jgi:hypothetical protein
MEIRLRGVKLHPRPERIDFDAYGKVLGWSPDRERWVHWSGNHVINFGATFID